MTDARDSDPTTKSDDDLIDPADPEVSPDDVEVDDNGSPHSDGNTDAGSNSDVASGGAPE